jgi:cytoskeletal protein CcmA (bactofilin family)
MFGRKPPSGSDAPPQADRVAPPTPLQQPAAPRAVTPPIPARPATTAGETESDAASRPVPAQPVRRPAEPVRAEPAAPPARELRKLVVGKDITLSGELACDHLIVEGVVEASVKECQRLEIAETGLFRGTVEIREADIGGRFEGEIIVQGRLSIRATGRIDGKIQYGELAVEAGGTIDGEIRTVGGKPGPRQAVKSAVKAPAPDSLPFAPQPETHSEISG